MALVIESASPVAPVTSRAVRSRLKLWKAFVRARSLPIGDRDRSDWAKNRAS